MLWLPTGAYGRDMAIFGQLFSKTIPMGMFLGCFFFHKRAKTHHTKKRLADPSGRCSSNSSYSNSRAVADALLRWHKYIPISILTLNI